MELELVAESGKNSSLTKNPPLQGDAAMKTCAPTTSAIRRTVPWKRLGVGFLTILGIVLGVKVTYENRETFMSIISGTVAWPGLAIAIACMLGNQLVCVFRWTLLVRVLDVPLSIRTCFDLAVTAELAHFIVPIPTGGDVTKLRAAQHGSVGVGPLVTTIVLDRACGFIGLLVVGGLAGAMEWTIGPPASRAITRATASLLAIVALLALVLISPSRITIVNRVPQRWRWLGRVAQFVENIADFLHRHPGAFVLAIILSTISQTMTLSTLFHIGAALNPSDHASWRISLIAGPWVLLSAALPLPNSSLGVTEQVSEEMFRVLGHRGGAMTTLVYRIVLLAGALLLTSGWMGIRRWLPAPTPAADA